MYFFVDQGRLASYDTYLMGWVSLAVTTGWAALHLQSDGRPGIWSCLLALFSGVASGAAILAKGPIAILFIVVPILLRWAFCEKRLNCLSLLVLVALAGSAVTLPWYVYIFRHFPLAGNIMSGEFKMAGLKSQPFYYYFALFGFIFPWCFSLLGSVSLPRYRKAITLPRMTWLCWSQSPAT